MEGAQVRRGFSLIEVMVALCILMVTVLALFRMHLFCTRALSYTESFTRAAVLAGSSMMRLDTLPPDAPDLDGQWHQDPGNPIMDGNVLFYRFWVVHGNSGGRDASVYVAWTDRARASAAAFGSEGEIAAAACPKVCLSGLLVCPR